MSAELAVTGALGGLGANVVAEATRRGIAVRALTRREAALPEGATAVRGDALLVEDLVRLTEGAAALVHAVNVSFSADWERSVTRLLDAAIAACRRTGARLVYPGNVWVFGRGRPGTRYDERAPHAPCSSKGRTRAGNEATLRASGVSYSVVRLPEFYGPHVTTLTGPPLRNIAQGRTARWFGDPDLPIELVYMPDAARLLVDVATDAGAANESFHLPGASAITPRAFFAEGVRQAGGRGKLQALPTWVVRAAGVLSPSARAFSDILHLWEAPILLDGGKARERFDLRPTPYSEGLERTLGWLREHPDVKMHY
ncbi:MAG: sugar nucleotide-binding protein [Polyangiaceae bacterium]|nr:sugar nucleotide-binding protein [Polyangiaceae bacterium]